MPAPTSQKTHSVTAIATAAIKKFRLIGYDGAYATSGGGAHDAQGVSENDAAPGRPVSLITSYSAPVEAAGAIAPLDYIKPADDGSGRAAVGSASSNCGRALTGASGAGELIELRFREQTSFSGGSSAGDAAFSPAGIDTIVVATATPIWFPAAGYTKALIAPSTASEGVRIAVGGPEAVSQNSDRSVMTADNAAVVLAIDGGFSVRRAGANNCTAALRLGN